MDLLATWRTLYKLRYCPVTLIQTAFSAGTVYLLIAMQASSGSRIARKDLRQSLDKETLVQQYLQEIGFSWNCATHISATLRNLMNEQVRPLLDLLDRKNIHTNPSLQIVSADMGDDEESNSGRSRSSSRKRSSATTLAPEISHPHNIPSGSGQSSLSTAPNHILTFPTQVSPPAKPSISPTITISSARDALSTHAAPSDPIAIHSLRSTSSNPSGFTDSWGHQPSPDSSPNFNYLSSFTHPDSRKYAQPFSNFTDDPFSGNGNSDDVDHAFGNLVSFLAHNFQPSGPSSENPHVDAFLGMPGGQTLPEEPFVGFLLNEVEDNRSPDSSNFPQAPFGTGFRNHEAASSSLGKRVPSSSHGDNDNMDLDNPWRHNFTS